MDELTFENHRDVLASCKVNVTVLCDHYTFQEIAAHPLEPFDPRMQAEAWYGDHWRFSTVSCGAVSSVLDTWLTLQRPRAVCILQLRRGGYHFVPWDRTLCEAGAGI